MDQLRQLEQAMAAHPGAKAYNKWNQARRIVHIYRRNTEELTSLIVSAEQDQRLALELVQNVHEPVAREEFALAFDQHFFNMSASVGSSIDYLRTLIATYSNSAVQSEYNARNDRLKSTPLGSFMKDFRNYLLHVGLPPLRSSYNFQGPQSATPGEWSSQLYVPVAPLLTWSKWSASAKQYIRDNDPRIDIGRPVREYYMQVSEVHDWVFKKFHELHGADMDSYNELVMEYNRTLTGAASDGR